MSSYQHPEDQDYIDVQQPYESQDDWDDAWQHPDVNAPTPRQGKASLPSSSSSSGHSGKSRDSKKHKDGKKSKPKITVTYSGSDTEKESTKMTSGRSSRKDRPSKHHKKTDDWTEVTEPDERRRIQNRIAQRKFREKARENRDRAARDALNQQHAGSAYHIPGADDLAPYDYGGDDSALSGLPWGGLSVRHVVARGHAAAGSGGGGSGNSAAGGGGGRGGGGGGGSGGAYTTTGTTVSSMSMGGYTTGQIGSGGGGDVMVAAMAPEPDYGLYHHQMHHSAAPYGYAPPPQQQHPGIEEGDVYAAAGSGYPSPYAGSGTGYYEYDPAAGPDGAHGM